MNKMRKFKTVIAMVLCIAMILDMSGTVSLAQGISSMLGESSGDKVNLQGNVNWSEDSYWSEMTRPDVSSMKLKVYLDTTDGESVLVDKSEYSVNWSDLSDKYRYTISGIPKPAENQKYRIVIDGVESYSVAQDGVSGDVDMTGENYSISDIEAKLNFKDIKILSKVEGNSSGDERFSYDVEVGTKDNKKKYSGKYEIGSTIYTTDNGVVSGNSGSTIVVKIPESLECEVSTTNDNYIIGYKEDEAENKHTFTYVGLNSGCANTVVWNDNNNKYNSRKDLKFTLKYKMEGMDDYEEVTEDVVKGWDMKAVPELQKVESSSNKVTYSYGGLPGGVLVDGELKAISYIMEMDEVDGYITDISEDDGKVTILNTYITSFNADIHWKDGDKDYKFRPDDVGVKLYRYTKKISEKSEVDIPDTSMHIEKNSDNWKLTIDGLPAYDSDGYPYTYFVVEDKPEAKSEDSDGNEDTEGAEYSNPKYTNEGDHAIVTDKCFNGGTIVNTKRGTTDFSVNYKWTADEERPQTGNKIYLWRYTEGQNPETAAVVKIISTDESGNETAEILSKDIDSSLATGTEKKVDFSDLAKYDEEGKKYVYMAKAILGNQEYVYTYPNDQLGAYDDELIKLIPQATVNKEFTIDWRTAAYPKVPNDWTVHVKLQKRAEGSDEAWEDVEGDDYKDLKFKGFSPEELEKKLYLLLPRYDEDGNNLEYQVVVDKLTKTDGSEATVSDGKFTIDGKTYETKSNGTVITNSLYDRLEYTVKKTWDDKSILSRDDSYAEIKLYEGSSELTDLDGNSCDHKYTKDDISGDYWTKTFYVNRYDERGYERDITLSEYGFFPRDGEVTVTDENGDNITETRSYLQHISYTKPAKNDNKCGATVRNYIPVDSGKYLNVSKIWKDGSDLEEREEVTVTLLQNGKPKEIKLNEGNAWYSEVKLDDGVDYSQCVIYESKIGETECAYPRSENDIVYTTSHAYTVSVTGNNSASWKITNKRVGKVKVKAKVEWNDGYTNDNRPNVTATLLVKNEDGKWEEYLDKDGNKVQMILKKDGYDNTKRIWSEEFPNELPKYNENGDMINYSVDISYENNEFETYFKTDESSNYVVHETEQNDDRTQKADNYTKSITLTRHSSTTAVVHKEWLGKSESGHPDIYLTMWRGVLKKNVGDDGNMTEEICDVQPYNVKETEYGKIEMIWSTTDSTHQECLVRNLDKSDENGDLYVYYFSEHINNPGEYTGYYFDTEQDKDKYEFSSAKNAIDNNYVIAGGYIVNRLEGKLTIRGTKQWKNLEAGVTDDDLPSPTILLRRQINGTEDTSFNQNDYKVVLSDDKYNYNFPSGDTYTLDKYNDRGVAYEYYIEENLGQAERAYIKTTKDDFALVNEYKNGPENSRSITVEKTRKSIYGDENLKYATSKFKLYRYETDADKDNPTFIEEKYVSGGTSKTGTCTFTNLRILSPRGNMYKYRVVETEINGTLVNITNVTDASVYQKEVEQIDLDDTTPLENLTDDERKKSVAFENTYVGTPEIKLVGKKVWNDHKNKDELRVEPSALDLTLYRYSEGDYGAGLEKIPSTAYSITWNKDDDTNWSYTIENNNGDKPLLLTWAPNGQRYKYKIVEGKVNNYNNDEEKTIYSKNPSAEDNTNKQVTMSDLTNELSRTLKVRKVWDDGSNQYGLRPSTVGIKIERKIASEDTWSEVPDYTDIITMDGKETDSKTNEWIYTYKGLAPCDKSGNAYEYRAVEMEVDGQAIGTNGPYKTTHETKDFVTTITNSIEPISLTVTKNWQNDNDDYYNTRPKAKGADGKATANWLIEVQLQYASLPSGVTDLDSDSLSWKNITGKGAKKNITGTKDDDSATIKFTGLPKCGFDGSQYVYRAVEIDPQGNYNMTSTTAFETGTNNCKTDITNTLITYDVGYTVDVKKTWYCDLDSSKQEIEAELVRVVGDKTESLDPKQIIKLNEQNNYSGSWGNLPKKDAKGEDIVYSVKESSVPERFSSKVVTQTGATTTNKQSEVIVNTELMDFKLDLHWVNNDFGLTDDAKCMLQRKVEGGDYTNVDTAAKEMEAEDSFLWENLPKFDSDGNRYDYRIVETEIGGTGITTDYKTYDIDIEYPAAEISTDLTKNDLYKAKVTNTLITKDYVGKKEWKFDSLNNNLKNSADFKTSMLPTDFVRILNSDASGTVIAVASVPTETVEKTDAFNWSFTYSNLPKYRLDGTTEINYSVTETPIKVDNVKVFAETYSGTTIKNALETADISGEKVWDDYGNDAGKRPSVDDFDLVVYANGNKLSVAPSVTWSDTDKDTWKFTVSGLPKFIMEDGKYVAAVYTVGEKKQKDYFAKDSVAASDGYKLTNNLLKIKNTPNGKNDLLTNGKFKIIGDFEKDGKISAGVEVKITLADGEMYLTSDNLNGYSLVKGKEYTVTQTDAAIGYDTIVSTIKFKIDDSGNIVITDNSLILPELVNKDKTDAGLVEDEGNTLRIMNDNEVLATLTLKKVDAANTTNALNGVKFEVKDSAGKTVGEFSTGKEYDLKSASETETTKGVLTIKNLPLGKYTVTEVETLDGYYKGNPALSIKDITLSSESSDSIKDYKVYKDLGTLTNSQVKIKVAEEEALNDLVAKAGIKLSISGKFADGDTKKEFTTTTDKTVFDGKLIVGETYTLSQEERPDGYKSWEESITFKIDNAGKIVIINNPKLSDDKVVAELTDNDNTLFVRHIRIAAVSLEVVKKWANDSDNLYGTRPIESASSDKWKISVKLQRKVKPSSGDGFASDTGWEDVTGVNGTKNITGKDSEKETKVTFSNLPIKDNSGNIYIYRAVETNLPGNYTKQENTTTVENSNDCKTVITNTLQTFDETMKINVEKKWYSDKTDTNNEVEAKLYAVIDKDGEEKEIDMNAKNLTLNSDNDFKGVYENLPKKDSEGNAIKSFKVKEVNVPKRYSSTVVEESAGEFKIVNTELMDYKMYLNWINNDFGFTDESTCILQRKIDGEEFEDVGSAQSLKGEDTYTWKNLPKFDSDGKRYTYQIVEKKIKDTVVTDEYKTYVIKISDLDPVLSDDPDKNDLYQGKVSNTLVTKQFEGTKKWSFDGINEELLKDNTFMQKMIPNDFERKLFTDVSGMFLEMTKAPKETVVKQKDVTKDWTFTYKNLPKYKLDGVTEINYKVEETPLKNYEVNYIKEDGSVLENKLILTELTGTKVWADFDNQFNSRPTMEEFKLTLCQGGVEYEKAPKIEWEEVSVNTWKYTFKGLPKYVDNKLADYSVVEQCPKGYFTANKEATKDNDYKLLNTVPKIINTNKDSMDKLYNAKFTISGQFVNSDGVLKDAEVTITLTDGELLLIPENLDGYILVPNRTYTVEQIKSAKSYQQIVSDIQFTINNSGQITLDKNTLMMPENVAGTGDAGKVCGEGLQDKTVLQIMNMYRVPGDVKIKKENSKTGDGIDGAEFTLYSNGETDEYEEVGKYYTGRVYDIETGEYIEGEAGYLIIKNLNWAKYKLVETKPADGYYIGNEAPEVEFTVDKIQTEIKELKYNGENVKNTPIRIKISEEENIGDLTPKKDIKLKISGKFAGEDKERSIKFTTTDDLTVFEGKLIVGETYVLSQDVRPDGYESWENDVVFHISPEGKIVIDKNPSLRDDKETAELVDDDTIYVRHRIIYGTLSIIVSDNKDKGIANVKFDLYNSDGEKIASNLTTDGKGDWFSEDKTSFDKLLPEGNYYLVATNHPKGYIRVPDRKYTFSITSDDLHAEVVEIKYMPISLKLKKVNTKKEELSGFVFEVTGLIASAQAESALPKKETIQIGDKNPEALDKRLVPGQSYTLKEIKAPKGYKLGGKTTFSVDTNGNIVLKKTKEYYMEKDVVVMIDKPVDSSTTDKSKKTTDKKTSDKNSKKKTTDKTTSNKTTSDKNSKKTSTNSKSNSSAKTGDTSNPLLWSAISFMSLFGYIFMGVNRRRKDNGKKKEEK